MLIKLEKVSKRNETITNEVYSGDDFILCRES